MRKNKKKAFYELKTFTNKIVKDKLTTKDERRLILAGIESIRGKTDNIFQEYLSLEHHEKIEILEKLKGL